MTDRSTALALYEQIAKMGTVLSSAPRLRILNLLCQCERTVESLSEAVKLPIATVSHHLQRLRRVRLVMTRKVGRHVTYAVADPEVVAFWVYYQGLCRGRVAELQVLDGELTAERKQRGSVDRIAAQELLKREDTVLWDLRPKLEYDAGHLPGAISCPFAQLTDSIKNAPTDKTILLYCRGPYCVLGDLAQQQLVSRGIRALMLTDGVPEWSLAGLPVTRSPEYKSLFATL
jgi:rhodanese-related sulfurtransferase